MKITKLQHNFFKLILFFLILTANGLLMNGCEEENNPVGPSASSYIMFIPASPDAPNVDIAVGGTAVAVNVPYLANTAYQTFSPGSYRVVIYVTATTTALIDTTIFLQQDIYNSLFIADSLQDIYPIITTDNLTAPGSQNSNIRFVHLSPNSPAFDAGAVQKVNQWFPFYSFGQIADFRAVVAGTYDLEMTLAGTTQQVALLPGVQLAQGGIYTMMAIGFNGASGNQGLGIALFRNK